MISKAPFFAPFFLFLRLLKSLAYSQDVAVDCDYDDDINNHILWHIRFFFLFQLERNLKRIDWLMIDSIVECLLKNYFVFLEAIIILILLLV